MVSKQQAGRGQRVGAVALRGSVEVLNRARTCKEKLTAVSLLHGSSLAAHSQHNTEGASVCIGGQTMPNAAAATPHAGAAREQAVSERHRMPARLHPDSSLASGELAVDNFDKQGRPKSPLALSHQEAQGKDATPSVAAIITGVHGLYWCPEISRHFFPSRVQRGAQRTGQVAGRAREGVGDGRCRNG